MRHRIPLDARIQYSHEQPTVWFITTPTRGKLCCPLSFVVDDKPNAWHTRRPYRGDTLHLHTMTGDKTITFLKTRLEGNIYAEIERE
jgi:hypothetical protein